MFHVIECLFFLLLSIFLFAFSFTGSNEYNKDYLQSVGVKVCLVSVSKYFNLNDPFRIIPTG